MDLKVEHEVFSVSEKLYDGVGEQNVELDYILPDYYPDIFKLIKCSIYPSITSHSLNGDTLSYDIAADIKILYCSEDNSLHCISQRLEYTKTLSLETSAENPDVFIVPKPEHINCRVVNKRRIDMRGSVSVKLRVRGESKQEAVSDVSGMNIQLKKLPVDYMSKKITSEKVITVSDETEVGSAKPPVGDIIRVDVKLSDTENKIIANKLVVKGEAEVRLLYTAEEGAESLIFSLPYSQIVDMDGIDEGFDSSVRVNCIYCDVVPSADEEGSNKKLKYELKLCMRCCAYKTVPLSLVSDVYSTAYPCEYASSKLAAEQPPEKINERFQAKIMLENNENAVSCVYDVRCTAKNINTTLELENKKIKISGMLCCEAMIKNESGIPAVLEKETAFEFAIDCDKLNDSSTAELSVCPIECSYTLADTNSISVKADVCVRGELYTSSYIDAVTDITVDENAKIQRDGDYAIKLYYGVKDEQIWDIAKKYSTSVDAVMEENSLDSESLSDDGMLLIPIV